MMISFKTVFLDPSLPKDSIREYKDILESLDSVLAEKVDAETDIIVTSTPEKYGREVLGESVYLIVMNEMEFSASLLKEKLGELEFEFNKDEDLRDHILRPYLLDKSRSYSGGVIGFKDVPVDVMRKLYALDFVDPSDYQNNSPTNKEFLDFGKKYPFARYHGYVVTAKRDDYRLSIEGMGFIATKGDLTKKKTKLIRDFKDLNNGADEFSIGSLNNGSIEFFSWFD
jgi:hypothetical protein